MDEDRRINVLDKGYVRLIDTMGDDRGVVNAARVSYDRESLEFDEKDQRLINFLIRDNHTAPFRHAICTYEVYAPLLVKNQWFKHLIGGIYSDDKEFPGMDPFFAWNESSRRYITENEEFYIPTKDQWRKKPDNSKQGSGGPMPVRQGITTSVLDFHYGDDLTQELEFHFELGIAKYRAAMEAGVAPEQARLFLPAYAMYVRWRWTTSLQGVMHFLSLRADSHAQEEIRAYARAVHELTASRFPATIGAMPVPFGEIDLKSQVLTTEEVRKNLGLK